MSEPQNIQWFPGHMAKTRRKIVEKLKMVDAVAEIIDARIPASSRNPELAGIVVNKPVIVLLNKADIADPTANKIWIDYFKKEGKLTLPVDCKSGKGLSQFAPSVRSLLSEKIERNKEKGMPGKTLRIMVVGVPNSGKSSFINRMAGTVKTKVADRPGVTRGEQWVTVAGGVELLDTAGVLWPKFEDKIVGERLAFTGAVKDVVTDVELLSVRLLEHLAKTYPKLICDRYKLTGVSGKTGTELLNEIAKKRGMLVSGGNPDCERAAITVLDEFRGGVIGRITLELPNEIR